MRSKIVRCIALGFVAVALLNAVACSPSGGLFDSRSDVIKSARDLQENGRYKESLEILRELLDSEDVDAETHYLHGVALRRTGEPGLAIWSLQKASETSEWEMASNLELAMAALANQSFATVIAATTRILELDPDHVGARSMRGEAYLGDRTQPEAALEDFEHLIDLDPKSVTARVQQASALLLLERTDEAEEAFDELAALGGEDPEDSKPQFCVARATFSMERGNPEDAEKAFDDCLERFPAEWIVVSEAIRYFDITGKPDRSDTVLIDALEEEPNSGAYRSALADRMRARGESAEAESLLRAGTELENSAAAQSAWTSLANLHLTQSKFQAAADDYERALEFGPDPGQQALLDFADLLSLSGQYDRALEVAEKFEQPLYRDLIHARVLLEKDEPAQALLRLDSALLLWPNNAAARYYAALASERTGQFDRAVEEYRQSIRAGGGNQTNAPMRLARLLTADGSVRAALVAIGHRFQEHPNDPEAILFALEISERLGDRAQIQRFLKQSQKSPALWSRALRVSAEAVARRAGSDGAADALQGDSRFDYRNPVHAGPTQVLLEYLHRANRLSEADELVASIASAYPNLASVRAAQGIFLEYKNEGNQEARTAYQRALELDAENSAALEGLARIEAEAGLLEPSIEYYDRAAKLDPWNTEPARSAGNLLASQGDRDRAEERYERILREVPHDADAAAALVRLRITRNAAPERTQELTRRVLRFGDEEEAKKLTELIKSNSPSAQKSSS